MKREAILLVLIFLATACAGDQGALDRAEAEKIVKQADAHAKAAVVAANGKAQAIRGGGGDKQWRINQQTRKSTIQTTTTLTLRELSV